MLALGSGSSPRLHAATLAPSKGRSVMFVRQLLRKRTLGDAQGASAKCQERPTGRGKDDDRQVMSLTNYRAAPARVKYFS